MQLRFGNRRGQAIADTLRIEIRQAAGTETEEPKSPDSPDSPSSVASSPSPTETQFPSGATATADSPSPTSTSFPSTVQTGSPKSTTFSSVRTTAASNIKTLTHASPVGTNLPSTSTGSVPPAPPAVTNPAVLPSTVTSLVLTTTDVTATSSVRQVTNPTETSRPTELPQNSGNGIGNARAGDADAGVRRSGLAGGQIALVTIASLGLATLVGFMIWRFLRRRKGANQDHLSRLYGSDYSSNGGPGRRPISHKSDNRIMDEMMAAVYKGENGRNSYQDGGTLNANGYMVEKYASFGDQQQQQTSIQKPQPTANPNPNATMDSNLSRSIDTWMNRQSQQQMLNPMTARNSMASSAAWNNIPPFTPGIMSESGAIPLALDPRYAPPMPQPPQNQMQNGGVPAPLYTDQEIAFFQQQQLQQQQQMQAMQTRTPPVPIDPANLRLPPPPGRRMSAAPTEMTSGTESTWNTWGVMQHPKPAKTGWKGPFGG